jgi:hypothetical protein
LYNAEALGGMLLLAKSLILDVPMTQAQGGGGIATGVAAGKWFPDGKNPTWWSSQPH